MKATPEEIIHGYIIGKSLSDITKIKSVESSIRELDSDLQYVVTSDNIKLDVIDEDDDDDWMNDPRCAEVMSATRNSYEKDLCDEKTRGPHSDGLQPILVLLGKISMIQQEVLGPAIEIIRNDQHYKYDIELREIDATQVTKDFVRSLSKPSGKDGGILVIKSITKFVEMYDVTDQNGLVRNIMVNPIGAISTGWRIIFIEETDSENIALNNSFVEYWTKGNLYLLFVLNDK